MAPRTSTGSPCGVAFERTMHRDLLLQQRSGLGPAACAAMQPVPRLSRRPKAKLSTTAVPSQPSKTARASQVPNGAIQITHPLLTLGVDRITHRVDRSTVERAVFRQRLETSSSADIGRRWHWSHRRRCHPPSRCTPLRRSFPRPFPRPRPRSGVLRLRNHLGICGTRLGTRQRCWLDRTAFQCGRRCRLSELGDLV